MKTVIGKDGGEYQVLFGKDICDSTLTPKTREFFEQLMKIDGEAYGGDEKGEDCAYVGEIDGYINRFGYVEKDGQMVLDPEHGVVDNIVAIAQKGKIIGYINYLTMDDALHEEIIHPDIDAYMEDPTRRDDGITGDQLRQWSKDKPNHLFILSIAVDKEHRDTDAIQVLTDSWRQELIDKRDQGYEVTSITCDTVSDHGEDAAKMFRCENVQDGDGKPVILPAMESDESGHEVTVRVCEGENIRLLLDEGFDFKRERTAKTTESARQTVSEKEKPQAAAPATPKKRYGIERKAKNSGSPEQKKEQVSSAPKKGPLPRNPFINGDGGNSL